MKGSNETDKNAAKREMVDGRGKKWKFVILEVFKLLNQLNRFLRNEGWLLPRKVLEGGEKRQ